MSKLSAAKTLLEIGKLAAETYKVVVDGRKVQKDEDKDRKIAELEAENKRLKEKVGEKA